MRTYYVSLLFLFSLCLFLGCGGASESYKSLTHSTANSAPAADQAGLNESSEKQPDAEIPKVGSGGNDLQSHRKVIYNGSIQLEVQNFSEMPEKIATLVESHGGFISRSQRGGSSGSVRRGSWTVRIPVMSHGKFLRDVSQIGKVIEEKIDSKDVTAEFYDLEARLSNKQHEETRLLEHLKTSTKDLNQILVIEKELSRVREEIERLQGNLRMLKDVTGMSTITLIITEQEKYIATTPFTPPTFGERIAKTWNATYSSLLNLGQWIVLTFIATGPWLVIILLPAVLLYLLLKRIFHRIAEHPNVTGV